MYIKQSTYYGSFGLLFAMIVGLLVGWGPIANTHITPWHGFPVSPFVQTIHNFLQISMFLLFSILCLYKAKKPRIKETREDLGILD